MHWSYFIKDKKRFSANCLNRHIDGLKLKGVEANDKPPFIDTQNLKVLGHALHRWVFIQFISVLIGQKINYTDDQVWKLLFQLREIIELVCSPMATMECVAHMKDCTEEYTENRVEYFPEKKLKSKHHFMMHYPDLTLQCGPLI